MKPIERAVGPVLAETVAGAPVHVVGGVGGATPAHVLGRALRVFGHIALLVLGVLVVLGLSPVLVALRVVARWLPGPVRGVARLALLFAAYLLTCEVSAVVGGLRFHLARRRGALGPSECPGMGVALARKSTSLFFGAGLRAVGMPMDCPEPPRLDPARPVVVLLRHAGLLNMQLAVHVAMKALGRSPHGVCKSAAVCLPGAAALVDMVPVIPMRWNAEGRAAAGREFAAMGSRLGAGDAALILPEGTNFSMRRRRARIASLRRSGRHDLAAAAETMPHVMAPFARGAAVLLANSPGAHVVVVAHTGLEDVLPWRLGRGYPSRGDASVHVSWQSFEAGEVPRDPDGFETWLYERWGELDAWVRTTRTGPDERAAPAPG
ncbi:hypothetical protein ACGFW5_23330 [Streptomyces sp. NPDC048416]|uniref:hypothetical protein n=1 Tax=Streptomyces sp. NPDC048416 TaxID=3365546 RepID=UPI0037198393